MSYASALRSSHSPCDSVPLAKTRVVEAEKADGEEENEAEDSEALVLCEGVVAGAKAFLSTAPRGRDESGELIPS